MRKSVPLAVALVAIIALAYFTRKPDTAAAPSPASITPRPTTAPVTFAAPQPTPGSAPATDASEATNDAPAASPPAPAVALSPEQKQAAIDRMHDAMVSYEPSQVPVIAAYLTHSDPELREIARDSLIQMGEAAAAHHLRAAAQKLTDPAEAAALLEAAEFLELPPARLSELRPPQPTKASIPPIMNH